MARHVILGSVRAHSHCLSVLAPVLASVRDSGLSLANATTKHRHWKAGNARDGIWPHLQIIPLTGVNDSHRAGYTSAPVIAFRRAQRKASIRPPLRAIVEGSILDIFPEGFEGDDDEEDGDSSDEGGYVDIAGEIVLGNIHEPGEEVVSRAEGREPRAAEIAAREAVVALRLQLANATMTDRVNAALAERSAASFFDYYDTNKDLSAYTLEQELTRNSFSVIDEGGGILEGVNAGEYLKRAVGDVAYLVRVANQSIFADNIAALTEHFRLCDAMASLSNPCDAETRYEVDCLRRTLDASLTVEVVIPTSGAGNGKLALARIDCAVAVALGGVSHIVTRRVGRARLVRAFEAKVPA